MLLVGYRKEESWGIQTNDVMFSGGGGGEMGGFLCLLSFRSEKTSGQFQMQRFESKKTRGSGK